MSALNLSKEEAEVLASLAQARVTSLEAFLGYVPANVSAVMSKVNDQLAPEVVEPEVVEEPAVEAAVEAAPVAEETPAE